MALDTREKLLDTAEALFAERGFYGVSIAAIANELGLTKQALLHHFGSKEKLYGDVLKRISERFEALGSIARSKTESAENILKSYLLELSAASMNSASQTRLLMRELLDNKRRADTASTWFLKPFLNDLILLVREIPNWQSASEAEVFALIYQLLGAMNYFSISEPTLVGIFGKKKYRAVDAVFSKQFELLIDAAIAVRR